MVRKVDEQVAGRCSELNNQTVDSALPLEVNRICLLPSSLGCKLCARLLVEQLRCPLLLGVEDIDGVELLVDFELLREVRHLAFLLLNSGFEGPHLFLQLTDLLLESFLVLLELDLLRHQERVLVLHVRL
jgi:hypothetical protein